MMFKYSPLSTPPLIPVYFGSFFRQNMAMQAAKREVQELFDGDEVVSLEEVLEIDSAFKLLKDGEPNLSSLYPSTNTKITAYSFDHE